jgi:Zn-dependent protease with chaperone function
METTGISTPRPVATVSAMTYGRNRFDAAWDMMMEQGFNAKRMPHANILESLDKMSAQLGVNTPRLYIADRFPAIYGGSAPNMAAYPPVDPEQGSAMVMTKSYLDLFKFHPHSEVPVEIRASLGHELGHVKQGGQYINAVRTYPMLLGPVVAMAGLYLYDQARQKKPADIAGGMREEARFAMAEIDERHCNSRKHMSPEAQAVSARIAEDHKSALSAIDYLLAGGAGFAGGALVTRQKMLALEYDADRTAALLVKDPEAMIRSLETFYDYSKKMPLAERRAFESELQKESSLLTALSFKIIHAHPSLEERTQALRKLGKSMALGLEKTFQHLPPF